MDSPSVGQGEVRRELVRMLKSPDFAKRPRLAKILRFLVEESLSNGFAPIDQKLIASHSLGLADGFNPTHSAYVRVNVARLRKLVDDYYAGSGRRDPVRLSITRGPYRVIASRVAGVNEALSAHEAREARRRQPMVLLIEPSVTGADHGRKKPSDLGRAVGVLLAGRLVESPAMTVSGPLRGDRVPEEVDGLATFAASLGYDYVVETAINATGKRWSVQMSAMDPESGQQIAHAKAAIPVDGDPRAAVDAVADWLFHRIGDTFLERGQELPGE